MKTHRHRGAAPRPTILKLCRLLPVLAGCLLGTLAETAYASVPAPGGNYAPTNTPLDSWTFHDPTNWTSDAGYAPVSFTNLAYSYLGDAQSWSLVLDTNVPAWLTYNVYESDGTTNLTVDSGSVTFWFAPSSWASTNTGGMGPGEAGRLLEVGSYTPDSSYGLWSIYVDEGGNNLYFSAQTNDLSSNLTTYLSFPISWNTNDFHFVALTYSATNTILYLDGTPVTNGPGVTVYPGPDVLAAGFSLGADNSGVYESHGMFNTVATYNYPLDSNDVQTIFNWYYEYYLINPFNVDMFSIASAPSSQTTFTLTNDVITGPGDLINIASGPCLGYDTNVVWITHLTATNSPGGTLTVTFGIEGGTNGIFYDVFANSVLSFGPNGTPWSWMGQGQTCQMYQLTNLPNTTCFLILGTPQDTDGDGLTDAYELLVSKSNPNAYSTDTTGMADGWEVLYFGHTGVAANGDPDGDGLTTFQEWLMNSKSYNPVKWNSFNSVGDGYQDYSGDGLANLMESAFGGNLMTNNTTWKANFAGDGFPDEYKTMIGLSTNSAFAAPVLPSYSKNPIQ